MSVCVSSSVWTVGQVWLLAFLFFGRSATALLCTRRDVAESRSRYMRPRAMYSALLAVSLCACTAESTLLAMMQWLCRYCSVPCFSVRCDKAFFFFDDSPFRSVRRRRGLRGGGVAYY